MSMVEYGDIMERHSPEGRPFKGGATSRETRPTLGLPGPPKTSAQRTAVTAVSSPAFDREFAPSPETPHICLSPPH
jgi:hypothetical protein